GDNRNNVIKFEKLPPPEFEFSNMSVEPDQVYVEEEVELRVDVKNTGEETIEDNILFHIEGEFIDSNSISLDSDESKTASITYTPQTSSTFEVEVAGLTDEFTVYDYPDIETYDVTNLTYHSATLEGELLSWKRSRKGWTLRNSFSSLENQTEGLRFSMINSVFPKLRG
ncbi:MAG: CARDB domain-containing protein, partial [Candidatus Natronoplasma sp.]